MRTFLKILAWSLLALLAVATLGPLGLRPSLGIAPSAERFLAFAVVGSLFGLAYRRIWIALLAVCIAAVALEALQIVMPGRHAMWADLGYKLAGGALGAVLSALAVKIVE